MLFCSQAFLIFFIVIFAVYWALPWERARVWLLLAASVFFYACWNKWLAGLIVVSTLIDYLLALGMERFTSTRWRRIMLGISLTGNLGLLCYFKYVNFFLDSLADLLHATGVSVSFPTLSLLVPVGISFYTFEAISYTTDVYRCRIRAERNLAHFMLFILFFPHLVAGPIVRARDFLPQVGRPKTWDWARLQLGVELILLGLVKKLAIADRMASFVDPIFADPGAYRAGPIWVAMFAYALQVYGDFSGYSDIAIGLAHMLGYKLKRNFDMPYLATSIADFWRRWHISLSSWLRDYVFFPLGGSRGGGWSTARNLLITMTLCGLWHARARSEGDPGACWTYVLFGATHGVLLILNRLFRAWAEARPRLDGLLHSPLGTALCVALTFTTFCFTIVLFRSNSLPQFGLTVQRMISGGDGLSAPVRESAVVLAYVIVGIGHWFGCQRWLKGMTLRLPSPVVGMGYACLLILALFLAPQSGQAFIYFQF